MERPNYLFSEGDLAATLDNQRRSIRGLVEGIPRDQLLATSVETLIEHVVEKLTVDPLEIFEDQIQMEESEVKIDVTGRFEYGSWGNERTLAAGHKLSFYLPFSGDPGLWKMRPSTYSSAPPRGDVDKSRSVLRLDISNTSNTEIQWYQNELKQLLAGIRSYLDWQRAMIKSHNDALAQAAREAIDRRRSEIGKLQGLASAFNIPLIKKPGMPDFKPVNVQKRLARALPPPPAQGFQREPAIQEELYEDVLANIRHMGATFEGTPQTYAPHGEEGLRDILLASLNGQYRGAATAEAFRKYGKTDIRIEEENRAAFVGECKLWKGERALLEALNQLLGYVTWRDVKTALIVFNKDAAGFSAVQQAITEAIPKHPLFLRHSGAPQPGEWRADFKSSDDAAREVRVHFFAFNLYVTPDRSSKRR